MRVEGKETWDMSKMPKETLLKSLTQPSVMLSNVEQRLSGQAAAAVSFVAADPVNPRV